MYGVSALGTRLCFYSRSRVGRRYTRHRLIPRNRYRINDTAPADRWNLDILEDDGEMEFRRMVDSITMRCAALGI